MASCTSSDARRISSSPPAARTSPLGPIEDVIKRCEFVSQALVLGDKRPFISALITLDEEALRPWLESKGLNRDMSMEDASSNAAVRAEVQKWVDQANEGVSRAESVRKFIILPEEFTQENGLMTASMKVIRPKVIKRYATLLNTQMYRSDTKRKCRINSGRLYCSTRKKSEAQLPCSASRHTGSPV